MKKTVIIFLVSKNLWRRHFNKIISLNIWTLGKVEVITLCGLIYLTRFYIYKDYSYLYIKINMLRITYKACSHMFFIVFHVLQGVTAFILQTRKLREASEIMGLAQRHILVRRNSSGEPCRDVSYSTVKRHCIWNQMFWIWCYLLHRLYTLSNLFQITEWESSSL